LSVFKWSNCFWAILRWRISCYFDYRLQNEMKLL
jgi:hypothetical protein